MTQLIENKGNSQSLFDTFDKIARIIAPALARRCAPEEPLIAGLRAPRGALRSPAQWMV
jgi:hypothetical protein